MCGLWLQEALCEAAVAAGVPQHKLTEESFFTMNRILSAAKCCPTVTCMCLLWLQEALCEAAVAAGVPSEVVYGDTNKHELPRLIHYIYVSS